MEAIASYLIVDKICENNFSSIYRCTKHDEHKSYILKKLRDYPSHKEIADFQREFQTTKNLNASGVIDAYEMIQFKNTLVMVLEDIDGVFKLNHLIGINNSTGVQILCGLKLSLKISYFF
ncbi:MAG: hypothetical protein MJE63_16745, partial [Proteobacteria bacterium]|nr:hypothetical protein [Pseudomonadota bacterium]